MPRLLVYRFLEEYSHKWEARERFVDYVPWFARPRRTNNSARSAVQGGIARFVKDRVL